ncbi:hypothetical protein BV898_19739 [Hypsibius exemplaris]|uniref:Uncharacterized protein n=1 Tax=Hypsibius exemplaris TaxID=2072580 RepID=A0A9X6RPX8_HYPEX|nr:hypothetical protein BV898_19739 [Hypsibius exemplaris]
MTVFVKRATSPKTGTVALRHYPYPRSAKPPSGRALQRYNGLTYSANMPTQRVPTKTVTPTRLVSLVPAEQPPLNEFQRLATPPSSDGRVPPRR